MHCTMNGVRLFVDIQEFNGKGRPDSAPVILALHGGPGMDHGYLRPFLSKAARWARVVYLDLRGAGRSAFEPIDELGFNAWTADICGLMDEFDLQAPILFGHSFGGFLAQHLVLHSGRSFGGLFLCNTLARIVPEDIARAFGDLGGRKAYDAAIGFYTNPNENTLGRFMEICGPYALRKPVDSRIFEEMLLNSALTASFVRNEGLKFDFRDGLRNLACPCTMLWGAYDPFVPKKGVHELKRALPRHTNIVKCGSSGHYSTLEQPKTCLSALRRLTERAKKHNLS